MDTSCLVLQDLTKEFGGLTAVDHVTLDIKAGERHGIIGPNGAGKTTLFNLITGELTASAGAVLFFDKDVTRIPTHKRIALGMSRTFQINNLFPKLTVEQNVLLAAQGLERTKYVMYRSISSYSYLHDKTKAILQEFEMWQQRDVLVENLSYGDQRQIEICLALIENPKLLLLDEPTAGLSRAESKVFTSSLKKLNSEMTILLIEHDMDVAFELVDVITVLQMGAWVATGSTEEIKANQKVQEIYLGTDT